MAVEDGGVTEGVAAEIAFVQNLTRSEGAATGIPGQAEQAYPLLGGGGIGVQVSTNFRGQRAVQVGFGGQRHQAAGTQQVQYLRHPGVHSYEQAAGYQQGHIGRAHYSPAVNIGVHFGGAQAGLGDLQIFDDLGD